MELTTFVGRDREVAELRRRVGSSRLLTLTGAGGSGKSRLALRVARAVATDLAIPVAWVELAGLEHASLIPRSVATACGLREEIPGGDPETLPRLLGNRSLLLVLDNCEHLVESCASLVDSLLRACSDLRILATSREALGVPGEQAWLVPPLELPAEGVEDAGSLAATESVRLFRERARQSLASWDLTDENAAVIGEICRRLDGMPLAIELAASRMRVLSPVQIRDRLGDAFRLLSSGDRLSLPRHRTLRATMDWSHDLLSDGECVLLRRLAVFRGGFHLEGAEAVCTDGPGGPLDALEVLAGLADRSLVSVRHQNGLARYFLLETVRQYAAEKLGESGEEEALRERHCRWIATIVEAAEPHLTARHRPERVAELTAELDNLREALAWSQAGAPQIHLNLVGRLWWFWFSTQHWNEAARWLEEALALREASAPGLDRARIVFAAGALRALRAGGADARVLLEEATSLAADAGDHRLEAYALNYLGLSWAGRNDLRAREPLERAAAWFRAHDDLYGLRVALILLGTSATAEGDLERAEALNLEGVEIARNFGLGRELALALGNLATVYLVQGRPERAEPVVREALTALRRDPSYFAIGNNLQYMAEILGSQGDPVGAARMLGASEAVRGVIGARAFPSDQVRLDAVIPAFRNAAGSSGFEAAQAEGRRMDPMQAIAWIVGDGAKARGGETADETVVPESGPEGSGTVDAGGGPIGGQHAGTRERVTSSDGAERIPSLRVSALGPFEVEVGGVALASDRWPYVKPRELLVLLLLNPRGRTRQQIGEALWPDSSPEQASNSFHVTVHHLRKALGRPEWIEREDDRYRLASSVDVWFDAAALESTLRRALGGDAPPAADLHAALALYRGDLLEGEPTGRWVADHRDGLRALYVDGILRLGTALEEEERWHEATELYAEVVAREDLNEELHRRLLTCWRRTGQRARALKHYERVEQLLREVLDAEPEPATRALGEALKSG
ncbi:MAG: BTAD domain-containing putative transcriptional regulator [Longimicrobiales bacterium]